MEQRPPAARVHVRTPPRLTNGAISGMYRMAFGQNLKGGALISRADVAHAMLEAIRQPETIRQEIGIAD